MPSSEPSYVYRQPCPPSDAAKTRFGRLPHANPALRRKLPQFGVAR